MMTGSFKEVVQEILDDVDTPDITAARNFVGILFVQQGRITRQEYERVVGRPFLGIDYVVFDLKKFEIQDDPTPGCPECRSGKCANCPGESLDFQDNIVECPCSANEHR